MMNRAYRLVWSRVKHQWIAVGERTSAHGKSKSTLLASKAAKASRALALAAGVSLLAVPAVSVAATWIGGLATTGDWFAAPNWTAGVVPLNTDSVYIDLGTAQISGSTKIGYSAEMRIGDTGPGILEISSGGTLSNSANVFIGGLSSGSGLVTIDGLGSTLVNNTGSVYVGYNGAGDLDVRNGGTLTSVSGGIFIGLFGDGTAIVDGIGSTLNVGFMKLGDFAAGNLTISNDAVVNVGAGGGSVYVSNNGGAGTLNIGAAQGEAAAVAGTLNATQVYFFGSSGALMFNHTSTAYDFAPAVSGAGSIDLYAGTTRFTGDLSQFAGTMTVDGGTLSIASGDNLSTSGNYTQTSTGTLKLGVAGDSAYGKMIVFGTATLDGALFVDAASATGLTGASLNGIIQAGGGVSGTFASYSDNSSLFNFTPVYREDGVDLTVTAAGSGGGGSGGGSGTSTASTDLTAYSAVTAMGNSPAVGAARVLDSIFQSNPTGGISQLFYSLNGTQAVSNAVAQTLPLMTASMNRVAINSLHSTNRVIQARQDANVGMSSGDDFLGDRKIWLKPVGSWARQDNRKGVAGYDADTFGLIGGADGTLNEATRIGVAFSYMNSNVDGKSTSSSNSAEIDAYQLITYGSHDLAALPDTAINWQADIGINKNEGRRAITFGGLNRVAKSDYDSLAAHVGIGLSRNYALSEKTTITSGLRADYTWLRDEGYIEKGADALNLQVKGHSTDELILMAEGRISHKLGDKSVLIGNAGIGYDVLDSDTSITASYVGGGTAFQTTGLDMSPWLSRAGMGLVYNASDTTEITARYDIEARSDFLDQTASVKVRWAF